MIGQERPNYATREALDAAADLFREPTELPPDLAVVLRRENARRVSLAGAYGRRALPECATARLKVSP